VSPVNVPSLVNTVAAVLPSVVELIRSIRGQAAPDQPTPTDAEIIGALNEAIAASLAKDAAWRRDHPPTP
jgi:hypothetical protein